MATTEDYIEYVCERLHGLGALRRRKMFGEYLVYVDEVPVLLVCDNTVFVKELGVLAELMADAERGYPYEGAREYYILDVDDPARTEQAVALLKEHTPRTAAKRKAKRA